MEKISRILFFVGVAYFLHLSSIYIQLPGFIGENGIAPVASLDLSAPKSVPDFISGIPTLLRFRHVFGLSAYHCTELLIMIGLLLSILVILFPACRNTFIFIALWLCYFSVLKVLIPFANCLWSVLLSEVGFLCILLSCKFRRSSRSPAHNIVNWLMRWLLFRVCFSIGYCKLGDRNSIWWSTRAMEFHLDSQLLPTPLAWYISLLPQWILAFSSALVIMAHLILPFLFLIPIRGVGYFCFYTQMLLNFKMLLTGNYGIYNFLIIALCYSCLSSSEPGKKKEKWSMQKFMSWALSLTIIGFFVSIFIVLFTVTLDNGIIKTSIAFTYDQFDRWSLDAITYTVPFVFGTLLLIIIYSICRALCERGFCRKMSDLLLVLLIGFIAICLLSSTIVPFSSFHRSVNNLELPSYLRTMSSWTHPLGLANDYLELNKKDGTVIFDVNQDGRSVLVFEGSSNAVGPWTELSFYNAPGRVDRMPSIIPGHTPVVDVNVLMEAKKPFEKAKYLPIILYRILKNNRDVMQLIEPTGSANGPEYIRIKIYNYKFTKSSTDTNWWKRKLKRVYLQPTSASSPHLLTVLENMGLFREKKKEYQLPNYISFFLDQVRASVGQPRDLSPFIVVLFVLLIANRCIS